MNQLLEAASSFLKEKTEDTHTHPASLAQASAEKQSKLSEAAESNPISASGHLMQKVMPVLAAMQKSSQNAVPTDKQNLLYALKPFVAADVGRQMERAVHLISMTRMAKTAMRELGGHHTASL